MAVSFCPTEIPEVVYITAPVHEDPRGNFTELYRLEHMGDLIHPQEFVQENVSFSVKHTLRGLHYQVPPYDVGKLVTCIKGHIYDVAVDIRSQSPSVGQWVARHLEGPGESLWIPPGFAHGFYALEDSVVLYRQTNYYNRMSDRVMYWNDETLAIEWPVALNRYQTVAPILSEKDNNGESLQHVLQEELSCDWTVTSLPYLHNTAYTL